MDENLAHSRATPIVIAIAALLLLLSAYAGLYVAGTTGRGTVPATGASVRLYWATWQAMIFIPASSVESALSGREVHTGVVTSVVQTK